MKSREISFNFEVCSGNPLPSNILSVLCGFLVYAVTIFPGDLGLRCSPYRNINTLFLAPRLGIKYLVAQIAALMLCFLP